MKNMKMNSFFKLIVLLQGTLTLTLLTSIEEAQSAPLSYRALYFRCYSQITGKRPVDTDALTMQVSSNQVNALTACMQILDRAQLVANGRTTVNNSADPIALAVLRNMHNLHASWFQVKDWVRVDENNDVAHVGTLDLWDNSMPALYFTRSLFDPNVPYSSIVSGTDILGAVRTNMDPVNGVASNQPKTAYAFTSPFSFAPVGALIGVRTLTATTLNYTFNSTAASVPLYGSLGGGLIGNYAYINQTLVEGASFRANGGVEMPRKYGRAIYQDLFCRDLPVVRTSDGDPFVVTTSSVPFRQSAACASCHASMDRISSVARGVKPVVFGTTDTAGQRGAQFITFEPVSLAAETSWPSAPDSSYFRRPPNGVLFFRNYLGNLVSANFASAEQLGSLIAQQDDFYLCAAKRYYAYFTGVTANLSDLGDPRQTPLSAADTAHRNIVIDLGRRLRTHNSLRQLINDILALPHYRDSNYGLSQ